MKLAANLGFLFTEHPFLERFRSAAVAGFEGVEYAVPYDHPREALARELKAHDLAQALFNMPAGDWANGERGIAGLPGREAEFRRGIETTLSYADALGCRRVNCLAGIAPKGARREELLKTLAGNLATAAEALKREGVALVIEPINFHDMPGFILNRSAEAMAVIEEVGHDNLALQYDVYHMQRMEGALAETLGRLMPRIGHIQVADTPGRHEPGTGEINYRFVLAEIGRLGYTGWVGAEYHPLAGTAAGLGWRDKLMP